MGVSSARIPKVEHEQMHRNQRHDQAALGAECQNDRRHQRRNHDVVGGGRQAHAEDQAHHRHQYQHDNQVAARQELDELADYLVRSGERDGADNDTGRAGGNGDADHVA